MNKWRIIYIYNGKRRDYVLADTLELALKRWRSDHLDIPGIALESITCVK